jgi:hypothetical protein
MVTTDFDAERECDDEQFFAQSIFRSDRMKVVLGYFEPGQFVPVHSLRNPNMFGRTAKDQP